MQTLINELNTELRSHISRVLSRVEGNTGCFNDVIIFRNGHIHKDQKDEAKFNLIYFGGDVQVCISSHANLYFISIPETI